MLSTSLNNENVPITVRSTLASLATVIDELQSLVFGVGCGTQFDITDQIPLWIVYEKTQRETDGYSGTNIFDFMQKYYDWLYCDSGTGAQYELSARLLDLIDIETTKSKFLERISNTYVHGFDMNSLEENGGVVLEENLRKFTKNIKTSFYNKKTTESGIIYFFNTLFGIDEENIKIEIPKKYILRLNGGRFKSDSFSFPGGTGSYETLNALSGSHLNGSRLQDSNWFQDWSYLLKVGIAYSNYKKSYTNIAHPAGLKVLFEKTLEDYQGATFDETNPFVCEYPMLKNYSPYGISFNYENSAVNLQIYSSWIPAPDGITLCGLSFNTSCSVGYTGFCGPTHLFPSWSSQTDVFNFRGINISTMLELCYPADINSPNHEADCSI